MYNAWYEAPARFKQHAVLAYMPPVLPGENRCFARVCVTYIWIYNVNTCRDQVAKSVKPVQGSGRG